MSKNIEVSSINKDSPARRLFYVLSDRHWNTIKNIIGKVLTIIDASISDREQRKALKDITEQSIYGDNIGSEIVKDIINQFCEKYSPELKGKEETKFWESRPPQSSENYFPNN